MEDDSALFKAMIELQRVRGEQLVQKLQNEICIWNQHTHSLIESGQIDPSTRLYAFESEDGELYTLRWIDDHSGNEVSRSVPYAPLMIGNILKSFQKWNDENSRKK